MRFPKFIIRLIATVSIIAVLTLVVCVVLPNSPADDHAPVSPVLKGSAEGSRGGGFLPEPKGEDTKTESMTGEGEPVTVKEEDTKEQSGTGEEEDTKEESGSGEEEDLFRESLELPRIVCWGDSLTESSDEETAYPDVLRRLSGAEVDNYGVSADTSFMVAARAGYVGIYTNDFTIPAEKEPVRVYLRTEGGNSISLLRHGDGGVNPCYIAGVRGRLSRSGGGYYFTRSESGDKIAVEDGSRLITAGMARTNSDDVLVIFTGTNDSPDRHSISEVIKYQRGILEFTGCEKYVVIGMTCRRVMPDIEKVNEILAGEYGEHFLDVRQFMLNGGLEYEGLAATARDRADMAKGEIPSSLRIDYVHGNKYFYDIIANMLYEKLGYLGYLPGTSVYSSYKESEEQ